jgi:hypothetical protein
MSINMAMLPAHRIIDLSSYIAPFVPSTGRGDGDARSKLPGPLTRVFEETAHPGARTTIVAYIAGSAPTWGPSGLSLQL